MALKGMPFNGCIDCPLIGPPIEQKNREMTVNAYVCMRLPSFPDFFAQLLPKSGSFVTSVPLVIKVFDNDINFWSIFAIN